MTNMKFRITTNGKMFRVEACPGGGYWMKYDNTVYGDIRAARNAKAGLVKRAQTEAWKPVEGEPVE